VENVLQPVILMQSIKSKGYELNGKEKSNQSCYGWKRDSM